MTQRMYLEPTGEYTEYPTLDTAMNACFERFPAASFSLPNESATKTWLNVYNGPVQIGWILEEV